ncbi:hypothetical protein [uncultured Veillonella sp.]|uniref:hypothetical protein n=1 Tax=uncultured Veillonella sp. TaxID=159268 RepID=UPI0026142BD2|nr:hypothetical protein [uncultured Veillonella sp.]
MKPMCFIAHFVIIELLAYLFECNYRIIMAIRRYGDTAIRRYGDTAIWRCDVLRLDIIRCEATDR